MFEESDNQSFDAASLGKMSDAKLKILQLLWSMDWVDGSDIFRAINQTYYDRRVRDLRESGWQIESKGSRYRLLSRFKEAGNTRVYPNAKQKDEVRTRDKGRCQICGIADPTIQFDHKVPLERLGPTTVENLQLLCRADNVEKRGACRHCLLPTCDGCPYAYPELFAARLVIALDKETAARLQAESETTGIPDTVLVKTIIADRYK